MMIRLIMRCSILNRRFIQVVCFITALLLCPKILIVSQRVVASSLTRQAAQSSIRLNLGAPIENRIASGQSHQFRAPLGAGDFMRLEVEQFDVDVEVTVFDPDRKQLLQVDNNKGPNGTESVSIVAEKAGDYQIQVNAPGGVRISGRYRIELKTKRTATPQDRDRVKAERILLDGWLLEYGKDFPAAIRKCEEACELFRRAGDLEGEARALTRIGRCHVQRRQIQEASDALLRALSLHRDIFDRGETLNYLADIYLSKREWGKSLEANNQALALFRQARNPNWEAITLGDLGVYYHLLDEQQLAMEFSNKALEIFRKLGDRTSEAEMLHNLGLVYLALGDSQQAKRRLEDALKIRVEVKSRYGHARTLTSLGVACDNLGAKEQALNYHSQALKILETLGPGRQKEVADTLNNIGQVYNSLSKTQQALDYHNRGLELRRKTGDKDGEAISIANIGAAYESSGNLEEALKYYFLALPIYQKVVDRRREAITLAQIARVERSLGKYAEALARVDASLRIIEELRVRVSSPELRASYLATAQDYYELYIDLLMRMDKEHPSGDYKAEALRVSERARARSLLDLLAEARADIRAGADPALLESERKLEFRLRDTSTLPKQEVDELLSQYLEVKARIRSSNPRYATLTQPVPLTLTEIQRQLNPETLLLEYSLGEERSYLWIVSPNELISCELPKRKEIESAVEHVYELLTARARHVENETPAQSKARVSQADKEYVDQAMALSLTLLGPAMAQLGKKRLLIVAAGKLQLLPFAALPIPDSAGKNLSGGDSFASYQPLITEHEIVNLPSASTLDALRREADKRPSATKTIAIFADPVYSKSASLSAETRWSPEFKEALITRNLIDERGSFKRLPFSLREANGISSLAPASRKLVATGFNASRANVMSLPLGQFRNVHFVTHGILDEEHPELSGLALSLVDKSGRPQDGFLRLHDVYNLNLSSTELVVLSACQTGLGKNVRGEGLVGLTRGFMYAGSPRVVASLWVVNDWGTSGLMKRFYQAMLGPQKLSPAAALRDAQQWMRRQTSTPEWQAPYYWAAFTLQGEWK